MEWHSFSVSTKADLPRSLATPEGIEDRLRMVAFAELVAHKAFLWASEHLEAAPNIHSFWRYLAQEEAKHAAWLIERMQQLNIDPAARKVSNKLWLSLIGCTHATQFAHFMASAEERGTEAGLKFFDEIKTKDPITAGIFLKIAQEEKEHVSGAYQLFPLDQPTS